jgi:amidophosphoribosyltransferase
VIAPEEINQSEPTERESFPQHECGLFGVFGHPNAAVLTYYGLFALQHRGQESAGIVTSNGPGTTFLMHKDMGLVSQVFGQDELEHLKGTRALGHTRYSTTGTSTIKNAQPFVVDCVRGQMAIAHNGNLTNADILRDELERKGSIFQTTADSEIILHLLAQPSGNGGRNSRATSCPAPNTATGHAIEQRRTKTAHTIR